MGLARDPKRIFGVWLTYGWPHASPASRPTCTTEPKPRSCSLHGTMRLLRFRPSLGTRIVSTSIRPALPGRQHLLRALVPFRPSCQEGCVCPEHVGAAAHLVLAGVFAYLSGGGSGDSGWLIQRLPGRPAHRKPRRFGVFATAYIVDDGLTTVQNIYSRLKVETILVREAVTLVSYCGLR